jgi:hypothetical protein
MAGVDDGGVHPIGDRLSRAHIGKEQSSMKFQRSYSGDCTSRRR